ncbi:hypothetical protein EUX98_g5321 [Antrodiella citrinella]|uniref:Uncharacterized protein n=1 Tax=Antrodiella citrinella TaxID=2447956 RepID=A0A4V3XIE0_9APHY|nr:hypothetical protein EUX98_g5321 [Antrodiella citrinella]
MAITRRSLLDLIRKKIHKLDDLKSDARPIVADWKLYVGDRTSSDMSDVVKRVLGETRSFELGDKTINVLVSDSTPIRKEGNNAAHLGPANKLPISEGLTTSSEQDREILRELFRFVYGEDPTFS